MSRTQAFVRTIVGAMVGMALLAFLLFVESPRGADGQLDRVNVGLFFVALMLTTGSLGSILLLFLHNRWPALAGAKRGAPDPAVAMRQGVLIALVAGTLAILTLLQRLDLAYVLGAILLAGLIEAFFQSR